MAKRPKLEPVITEGEVPGETIEVVGADDDIWANQDMIHHEAMIDIERKKSVHFNKVDPDLLEKARQQVTTQGILAIKPIFFLSPHTSGIFKQKGNHEKNGQNL